MISFDGFFERRETLSGAISGMATGALTVIIRDYIPLVNGQTLYAATNLYSLVVGFGLALIAPESVERFQKSANRTTGPNAEPNPCRNYVNSNFS